MRQSILPTLQAPCRRLLLLCCVILLASLATGCEDDQYKTVAGLQEQNRVLQERIATLEQEKAELLAHKQSGDTATEAALRLKGVPLRGKVKMVNAYMSFGPSRPVRANFPSGRTVGCLRDRPRGRFRQGPGALKGAVPPTSDLFGTHEEIREMAQRVFY